MLGKFKDEFEMTGGQNRAQIKPGQTVSIVLKKDQRTGALTQGIVKKYFNKIAFPSPWYKSSIGKWPCWKG